MSDQEWTPPKMRGIFCRLCEAVMGWERSEPLPKVCPMCGGHGKPHWKPHEEPADE